MSDWAETAAGVGLAVAGAVLVYLLGRTTRLGILEREIVESPVPREYGADMARRAGATPEPAPVDGHRRGGPG